MRIDLFYCTFYSNLIIMFITFISYVLSFFSFFYSYFSNRREKFFVLNNTLREALSKNEVRMKLLLPSFIFYYLFSLYSSDLKENLDLACIFVYVDVVLKIKISQEYFFFNFYNFPGFEIFSFIYDIKIVVLLFNIVLKE